MYVEWLSILDIHIPELKHKWRARLLGVYCSLRSHSEKDRVMAKEKMIVIE